MTERQIEKPGTAHRRNILRNLYVKFYSVWSVDFGEMASDGRTGRRTDGRTDEATSICSPFGKRKNILGRKKKKNVGY